MIVKLLTDHHLEFLSLKEGRRGSSQSTLVKMSNCWKSHAAAQMTLKLTFKVIHIYAFTQVIHVHVSSFVFHTKIFNNMQKV